MTVAVKRVYDEPDDGDGYRVLVDRLWPRGMTKERARVDEWLRDVAPSTELRKEFRHEPGRFAEFTERYVAELEANPATETLRGIVAEHGVVTLVYAAQDTEHNQAVVLRDHLADR
jgi:DNA-3-methyladenine glycosylase